MIRLIKSLLYAFAFSFVIGGCGIIEHSLRANHAVTDTLKPETLHTQTVLQPIIKPTEKTLKTEYVPRTPIIHAYRDSFSRNLAEYIIKQVVTQMKKPIDSLAANQAYLGEQGLTFITAQTRYNGNNDRRYDSLLARKTIVRLIREKEKLKEKAQKGETDSSLRQYTQTVFAAFNTGLIIFIAIINIISYTTLKKRRHERRTA